MTMKWAQPLLIFLLLAIITVMSISNRSRVESLNRRIAELEAISHTIKDDYETRIARLKAEPGRSPRAGSTTAQPSLLMGLLAKSPAAAVARKGSVDELREAIQLDDDQEGQVRSILVGFASGRQKVLEQAQAEKRFIFDPRSLAAINTLRRDTLERLKSVLSSDQYARMVEEGYDEKLGLRVAQPSR